MKHTNHDDQKRPKPKRKRAPPDLLTEAFSKSPGASKEDTMPQAPRFPVEGERWDDEAYDSSKKRRFSDHLH